MLCSTCVKSFALSKHLRRSNRGSLWRSGGIICLTLTLRLYVTDVFEWACSGYSGPFVFSPDSCALHVLLLSLVLSVFLRVAQDIVGVGRDMTDRDIESLNSEQREQLEKLRDAAHRIGSSHDSSRK
jgi:hypothetical protein